MTTKQKGNIAQLAIAADLAKRGFDVAMPFGEYGDWDLLVDRHLKPVLGYKTFEKVQVKYSKSDGEIIKVRSRVHSVTAGRVTKTKLYTQADIDWMAVYDPTSDACYYVHASHLGDGTSELRLRLLPPKNGMQEGIRWAHEYTDSIEPRPGHALPT